MRSGQNEEPISLLAESIVLYESAIAEHPELHDWQYRLALALHNLATLHNENRELKQAISYASRASRILSGLVTEYTDVVPYRLRLAEAKNLLGLTLISSGRPEEGAEVLHSALSIAKQLLANDPENLDLKRSLAAMLTNLSYAQLKQGRPLLAAQSIRDAYFYWKDPIQANPENPFYLDSIKSWLRVR
jgi:tetratricopeptide (TPR) repeat protein